MTVPVPIAFSGNEPGDPVKGTEIMVDVIRGEGIAMGRPFPTLLPLGIDCFETIRSITQDTLKNLDEWKDIIISTDLPKAG